MSARSPSGPRPREVPAIPPGADLPAQGGGQREAWWFNAVSDDGALAVAVCVGRRGDGERGWYWMVVTGVDRLTVSVVDPDLGLSASGPPLELRAPGLWADHNPSSPGGHWSVAAEAFGVALEDPWDAWGRPFGDPTPVGLDLEWDSITAPLLLDGEFDAEAGAWSVGCDVHGEVLVGPERFDLAGQGSRGRWWGACRWPQQGALEFSGWSADDWSHRTIALAATAAEIDAGAGDGWFKRWVAPSAGVDHPAAWAPVLDGCRPDGRSDRLGMVVVADPGDVAGWRGWVRWRRDGGGDGDADVV